MEGNTHLLQVIHKMRSQINKLERENRALRGELQVCGQRAERDAGREGGNSDMRSLAGDGEGPAGSTASLRGGTVTGPPPAPKEQTGTKEKGLSVAPLCAAHTGPPSLAVTCLLGMGDEPLAVCLGNLMDVLRPPSVPKPTFIGCLGKVKAVSFLLPMDMSPYAEKQGSLKSPQNQSTKQLTTITEKDM
ncbi:putative coiled-coil domain-containing protein 195 [Phaethornis superciliosus]